MQLERISSGSILQSIRSSDLRKVKIILPPAAVQKSIGDKVKRAVCAAASIRKNLEEVDDEILKLT